MRIGLASPNCDYGVEPAEMARDLEQRGYDSLWVGEHSHIPASRETPHPSGIELPRMYWHMRDPFVSLAVAAGATDRLELITGVCLVLEHEILDLTKSVATLHQASGGRLRLGVGGTVVGVPQADEPVGPAGADGLPGTGRAAARRRLRRSVVPARRRLP
jgi:alkanesulfonate monooxygenase SsuD/methylene tetrahydromethanopterin reductase-like flavin-dependent oxidoreductase (luciferase family)